MARILTHLALFLIGSMPTIYSEARTEPQIIAVPQWNENQLISKCLSQGNYPLTRRSEKPERWQHLVSSAKYPDGKYFICTSK